MWCLLNRAFELIYGLDSAIQDLPYLMQPILVNCLDNARQEHMGLFAKQLIYAVHLIVH